MEAGNALEGGSGPGGRPAEWSAKQQLVAYLLAATGYILLGFLAKGVFAWWPFGAAFLVAAIWGIPALWRRLG